MIDYGFYILIALYFLLLMVWSILLLAGYHANTSVMNDRYLPRSRYPFRELLGIGLLLQRNYKFENIRDLHRITQLQGVYGEKWGVFYYKINMAERLSYSITLALACLLVAPATGEYLLLAVCPVAAVLGYTFALSRITDLIEAREKELMKQFPNVVSNLALLINSGMDTFTAWENIAQNAEGLIYEEMRKTIQDMRTQGSSEIQAYIHFGDRCSVPRIKKFISMMIQNIRKGNDDLIDFLTYESSFCWEEKKSNAKIQGEKASNKLMIPIFMIMIGVLILVMGPMASNLGL